METVIIETMKRWVILFLLAGVFHSAYAWRKTYSLGFDGTMYSVRETSDGSYVVAGTVTADTVPGNYELLLLKADSVGDTIWTRKYGGAGNDEGRCIRQVSDSGYIIVGSVDGVEYSPGKLWLLKTDAKGDTVWTKRYGYMFGEDEGYWVEETSDGGYIITGTCNPTGGMNNRLWLLKTDAEGDTVWTHKYTICSHGFCVRGTKDSGYILASPLGLIKTDSMGDTLWTYRFVAQESSVCLASDGGYVFTATTWGSFGRRDIFFIKTDTDGDSIWGHSWGGVDEDYSYEVQQTNDGGYIIVGDTRSFGEARVNVWLLKTDVNGDTTWTRILGAGYGRSVQQTTDGGYIICGGLTLIKTDSLGYAGVGEQPSPVTHQPDWQVISPIGQEVVLRYHDKPGGFHAKIYDISGKKCDECHSNLTSGTLEWGEGMSRGVYFIQEIKRGSGEKVSRVILLH
ncbi:MAG: T9SS type A sorting domain-containing protein [Candidatus Stahlbacteria bacterium]|nr:MAG: T9SS type A sorting domain-containing protein [Candidatus Stahlbacteria bacterium]